jgi:hypothetical protein
MNFLARLFGIKPERRKAAETGFYWQTEGMPAVAAGRGWTQEVVGESFYRSALQKIAKGATRHGVMISKPAELIAGEYEGRPAVFVAIDGQRVGAIPKEVSADLHREIVALAPAGRVSAKGQISAGYEGADYCVKLSFARPLRIRTA